MTKFNKSQDGVNKRPTTYESFMGLDTYSDKRTLDTGKEQHLSVLDNGFADSRGQLVRDPGATKVRGDFPIVAVQFYTPAKVVYAEQDGAGINLMSEDDHSLESAFRTGSMITTNVFNKRAHFLSQDQAPIEYNGTLFKVNTSPALNLLRPAFATTVGRRMVVAGIRGRDAELHASRVDDHNIFPDDEAIDSVNVLRAAKIDITNQLDQAEAITGLSKFEQSRLAVFTSERTLIYLIDPDVDNWALDDKASINIGCVSHSTIKKAGTDVIFCSRSGVHFLRRSVANGITIESQPMSEKISILYRALIKSVDDPEFISAAYDPDMGQYHVFFPQAGGQRSVRLTVTIRPGDDVQPSWSTGSFMNARCAQFLGGRLVWGTSGGIYNVAKIEDKVDHHPIMRVVTPVLWHGSFTEIKEVKEIVLQAAGSGTIQINVYDDSGELIYDTSVEVDASPDDNYYPDVPLSSEYQIPLNLRYRGAQYEFKVSGTGLCRIVGFAVNLKDT